MIYAGAASVFSYEHQQGDENGSDLMKSIFQAFALLLFSSISAEASLTLHGIDANMTPYEKLLYISGVGSGYKWSNAFLMQEGKQPHFCVQKGLALNPKNYITIFEQELKEKKHAAEEFVEIILMLGLQRTFPCK